jgi:hypothetical protein
MLSRSAPASHLPSLRCYKIGNGRRSYNTVELRLSDGSGRTAAIQQCIHVATTAEQAQLQVRESQGSCACTSHTA